MRGPAPARLGRHLSDLVQRFQRGVLVADGAMGSMLARAFEHEKPAALARRLLDVNLTSPESVHAIHLAYIAAGADVIETNTFGASRARLERLGLGDVASRIVSEAVKIAREARDAGGREVAIAGSISPLDADWMLDENPDAAAQAREFEEQAALLLERGADLLVLETFSRLPDLLLALSALRRVSHAVPIVAQMSFDERGMLGSGEAAEVAARRVTDAGGANVLGVNCSLGPQASLAVLEKLARGTTLPLSIMPNAGFAQRLGGRVLYPDMSAAYYARCARAGRAAHRWLLRHDAAAGRRHRRSAADAGAQGHRRTRATPAGAPARRARRRGPAGPAARATVEAGAAAASRRIRAQPADRSATRSVRRRQPPRHRGRARARTHRLRRHQQLGSRLASGRAANRGRHRGDGGRDAAARDAARCERGRRAVAGARRLRLGRRPQSAGGGRRSAERRSLCRSQGCLSSRCDRA